MKTPTVDSLRKFLPRLSQEQAQIWSPLLEHACLEFGITQEPQVNQFMATIANESGEFTRLVENLNYSAMRLTQVWPRLFPDLTTATPYAKNPVKLGNLVYGNRLGNGPEKSGDGYRYRGRGLIQLTGKANYQAYNPDLDPDMLSMPAHAARSAAWFWHRAGCNDVSLVHPHDIKYVTRLVNGGLIGLDDRVLYLKRVELVP